MYAVFVAGLWTLGHLVLGVLVPGLWWKRRLERSSTLDRAVDSIVIRTICLGALHVMFALLIVMTVRPLLQGVGLESLPLLAIAITDFLFAVDLATRQRNWLIELARSSFAALRNPANATLAIGAIGLSLWSMVRCPFALDNVATYWTSMFLNGRTGSFATSLGSPGYIALLYFPGLACSSFLPLPTLAATLKLPLALLMALTVSRLVRRIGLQPAGLLSIAAYLTVVFSVAGIYGIVETAKESAFSIAFLFLYAAELLGCQCPAESTSVVPNRPQAADPWVAGLLLATTISFGAISVPYAAILTIAYLLFSLGQLNTFGWSARVLAIASVPLILTVQPMLHWPLWLSTIAIGIPTVLCAVLARWDEQICAATAQLDRYRPAAAGLLTALCIASLFFLLPVRFEWMAEGVVTCYSPLEGTTSFVDLLYSKSLLRDAIVKLGFAGLVLAFVLPRHRNTAGLLALGVFPFVTLAFALAPLQFRGFHPPFHPQHYWDLIKDIPNWCFGFYFGFFAAIAVDAAGRWIVRIPYLTPSSQRWLALAPALILAGFLGKQFTKSEKARTLRYDRTANFTSIGGHDDVLVAMVSEWAFHRFVSKQDFPLDENGFILLHTASSEAMSRAALILPYYGGRMKLASTSELEHWNFSTGDYWLLLSPNESSPSLDDSACEVAERLESNSGYTIIRYSGSKSLTQKPALNPAQRH